MYIWNIINLLAAALIFKDRCSWSMKWRMNFLPLWLTFTRMNNHWYIGGKAVLPSIYSAPFSSIITDEWVCLIAWNKEGCRIAVTAILWTVPPPIFSTIPQSSTPNSGVTLILINCYGEAFRCNLLVQSISPRFVLKTRYKHTVCRYKGQIVKVDTRIQIESNE